MATVPVYHLGQIVEFTLDSIERQGVIKRADYPDGEWIYEIHTAKDSAVDGKKWIERVAESSVTRAV